MALMLHDPKPLLGLSGPGPPHLESSDLEVPLRRIFSELLRALLRFYSALRIKIKFLPQIYKVLYNLPPSPSCPHLLPAPPPPTSLTLLQPQGPPGCGSSNMPGLVLPRGLCMGYSLCLDYSSCTCPSFSPFQGQQRQIQCPLPDLAPQEAEATAPPSSPGRPLDRPDRPKGDTSSARQNIKPHLSWPPNPAANLQETQGTEEQAMWPQGDKLGKARWEMSPRGLRPSGFNE